MNQLKKYINDTIDYSFFRNAPITSITRNVVKQTFIILINKEIMFTFSFLVFLKDPVDGWQHTRELRGRGIFPLNYKFIELINILLFDLS